ncbi:MAG: hypothetical protein ABS76_04950 [Pelagibacterium sp. SCN 64-44]|nr:MAG: hypothetical protein ABS76_04950 [Pelagibacterium sp. SCN 64-44]
MQDSAASVIIVGGGASGVLLAAQLLKDPDPDLRVTLIEQHGAVGQGLAYSARNRNHRVNVPARGMSAFADDPDHFWRWLQGREPGRYATSWVFVPRRVYGAYLEDVLREAAASRPERLDIVAGMALRVEETVDGVAVSLDDGRVLRGRMAGLALGHETQQARGRGIAVRVGSPEDTPLAPEASVMILGSGLSMVDAWVSLAEADHRGRIRVVSRNGLLPTAHKDVAPLAIAEADVPFGASLVTLLGWFRGLIRTVEAAGGDWRSVLDGLRPHNQKLWQSWSDAQKRQFLRHLRPWWNIHRHRLPPDLHARLVAAIARGQVQLIAAEFLAIAAAGEQVTATIRPRGTDRRERVSVARVYDCGGVSVDVRASANPLVRHLVETGAARPDRMHIGLDVDGECALVGGSGRASRRIHVVGPLTRGRYFEIEAIPDIRVQCANVARSLLAVLRGRKTT